MEHRNGSRPSSPTKAEVAYDHVRELVLRGALAPGAVIQQGALARELGISVTPLREALRRLMSDGLVELDAHRDARVSKLNAEEARDLVELRRSLDPLAAALAAERRGRADLEVIREAAAGLRPLRTDPNAEDLAAHRRFHAAIYVASHNELLVQTLDGLWDKADRYRRLALETDRTQEDLDRTHADHLALLEAVAAGDADGAAETMRAHIDASLGARAATRLGRATIGSPRGRSGRVTVPSSKEAADGN